VPSLGLSEANGKKILIEDNIARYVDAAGGNIETFDAFVKSAIAKKNTLFGPKSELALYCMDKDWASRRNQTYEGNHSLVLH
jgi:hypothetical protein